MPDPLNLARARWSGRTAVVTGAATGLGAGFAEVLAGNGARVVRCDVNADALQEIAGETVVVDVRDFDAVEEVAARIFRESSDVAFHSLVQAARSSEAAAAPLTGPGA